MLHPEFRPLDTKLREERERGVREVVQVGANLSADRHDGIRHELPGRVQSHFATPGSLRYRHPAGRELLVRPQDVPGRATPPHCQHGRMFDHVEDG